MRERARLRVAEAIEGPDPTQIGDGGNGPQGTGEVGDDLHVLEAAPAAVEGFDVDVRCAGVEDAVAEEAPADRRVREALPEGSVS